MISITAHHLVRYRKYTAGEVPPWDTKDHACNNLCRAAKGKEMKGGVNLHPYGASERFTKDERPRARAYLASSAALRIASLAIDKAIIIPIPNREGFLGNDVEFQTLRLAKRVALASLGYSAEGVLLWDRLREKQHEHSVFREPSVSYGQFRVTRRLDGHKVIIVDDVLTTGSQMLAATKILREAGADVVAGFTLIKCVQNPEQVGFGWQSEELSWQELPDFFEPPEG